MPAPPPGPAPHTRYFVMKALSFESMQQSVVSGSWSTQRHNQDKLNDAFAQGAVVFFFSVNMSGHFQGYAFMRSVVGPTTTCQVEWKVLTDLPFRDTESITYDTKKMLGDRCTAQQHARLACCGGVHHSDGVVCTATR